jgi:hypothetical protein
MFFKSAVWNLAAHPSPPLGPRFRNLPKRVRAWLKPEYMRTPGAFRNSEMMDQMRQDRVRHVFRWEPREVVDAVVLARERMLVGQNGRKFCICICLLYLPI